MLEREVNPENIKKADIVVGLPSYNEADSISYPTKQADIGLCKYFPHKKAVIINCDNNSTDGTEESFLKTDTNNPKIYITTPKDQKGKGFNFENIFRKTSHLEAEFLICVDADLKSIEPEWIKYFGEAILKGYDYATPVYTRHKYDGTITNNICYPLVYGLLGKDIRQPIGGDFALTGNFMEYLIKQVWYRTAFEYGIDVFMTMNAIIGGFDICRVGLGSKVHKPSAPNLGPMFLHVVNSAFFIITHNLEIMVDVDKVKSTPLLGLQELEKPQDIEIDKDLMKKRAQKGFKESISLLEDFLSQDNYNKIWEIFTSGDMGELSAELWSEIVYDMITAFKREKSEEEKMQAVESLRGIYFARFVSFIERTKNMDTEEAEKIIKNQAKIFFKNRNYLLRRLS